MRNKLKFIILSCLLLSVILLSTSCSSDLSPFGGYNKDGYTVSVKYDANGGVFTTNTETIIDTYNLEKYTTTSDGNKELKLFAPDAKERGNQAYTASRDNFYLAGWYRERVEIKDESGNVTGYTYGGRWDFDSDRLSVSADGTYNSSEAVITLYAAWVPSFTYEFYLLDSNGNSTLIDTKDTSPMASSTITTPAFDENTGLIGAPNDFPALTNKTYDKIYLSPDKSGEITSATISHSGSYNEATATLTDAVMKIYCTATEGIQYRITSAEQLIKSPKANGIYTLDADLDFSGKVWPNAFVGETFTGKIIGNGHTIKNVKITRSGGEHPFFGLFGQLSSSAVISDVTFEGITAGINSFHKSQNAAYGILAGDIEEGATLSGVSLKDSKIVISKGINLKVALNLTPTFGIVCGSGAVNGITFTPDNLTVEFTGTDATEYNYTPDANGQFTLSEKQS